MGGVMVMSVSVSSGTVFFAAEKETVLEDNATFAVARMIRNFVGHDNDLVFRRMKEHAGGEKTKVVPPVKPLAQQIKSVLDDGLFNGGDRVNGRLLEEVFRAKADTGCQAGVRLGQHQAAVGVGKPAQPTPPQVVRHHLPHRPFHFPSGMPFPKQGLCRFEPDTDIFIQRLWRPAVVGCQRQFGVFTEAIAVEVRRIPVASRIPRAPLGFVHDEVFSLGGDVGRRQIDDGLLGWNGQNGEQSQPLGKKQPAESGVHSFVPGPLVSRGAWLPKNVVGPLEGVVGNVCPKVYSGRYMLATGK